MRKRKKRNLMNLVIFKGYQLISMFELFSWFGQVQLKKKRKHQAGRWLENILASREENQANYFIAFSNLLGVLEILQVCA